LTTLTPRRPRLSANSIENSHAYRVEVAHYVGMGTLFILIAILLLGEVAMGNL
jgi:hypothetical protein